MTTVRTMLDRLEDARRWRFEPTAAITATNVQKAIEQVATTPQTISPTPVNPGISPYTPIQTDTVLYVDTSAGPVQINLAPSANRLGVPLTIKDVSGNAASNNITIKPNGSETLDGYTNGNPLLINANFGGFRINPRTSSYTIAP